jgi:hypothetical protein
MQGQQQGQIYYGIPLQQNPPQLPNNYFPQPMLYGEGFSNPIVDNGPPPLYNTPAQPSIMTYPGQTQQTIPNFTPYNVKRVKYY